MGCPNDARPERITCQLSHWCPQDHARAWSDKFVQKLINGRLPPSPMPRSMCIHTATVTNARSRFHRFKNRLERNDQMELPKPNQVSPLPLSSPIPSALTSGRPTRSLHSTTFVAAYQRKDQNKTCPGTRAAKVLRK